MQLLVSEMNYFSEYALRFFYQVIFVSDTAPICYLF